MLIDAKRFDSAQKIETSFNKIIRTQRAVSIHEHSKRVSMEPLCPDMLSNTSIQTLYNWLLWNKGAKRGQRKEILGLAESSRLNFVDSGDVAAVVLAQSTDSKKKEEPPT